MDRIERKPNLIWLVNWIWRGFLVISEGQQGEWSEVSSRRQVKCYFEAVWCIWKAFQMFFIVSICSLGYLLKYLMKSRVLTQPCSNQSRQTFSTSSKDSHDLEQYGKKLLFEFSQNAQHNAWTGDRRYLGQDCVIKKVVFQTKQTYQMGNSWEERKNMPRNW